MRELWKEREREFGCNEVYGGGWVMRLGESVRVQGEERQTERQLPNSGPSVGARVDLCV